MQTRYISDIRTLQDRETVVRAIGFARPGEFSLTELPDPVPGPRDAVVQLEAVSSMEPISTYSMVNSHPGFIRECLGTRHLGLLSALVIRSPRWRPETRWPSTPSCFGGAGD